MLKHSALLSILAVAIAANAARAAEALTPNTLRLTSNEVRPKASIDAMAWLAGTWRGQGLGGENEELWSAPSRGVMFGAYRMIKDGKPVFYELLTISEVEGSLEMRLKHFDPVLGGWEEKQADAAIVFPYIAQRDGRIYFEGMTFEPRADELTVYLAIEDRKSGTVREEIFSYQRMK